MSKHSKAARKASFRFHANPASEEILRVLRVYKLGVGQHRAAVVGMRVVGVWTVRR